MDKPGIPFYLLFLVFVVVPCGFAFLFGWVTYLGITPLAFRCCRCGGEFGRRAWKRFPARCPLCGAADWNLPE